MKVEEKVKERVEEARHERGTKDDDHRNDHLFALRREIEIAEVKKEIHWAVRPITTKRTDQNGTGSLLHDHLGIGSRPSGDHPEIEEGQEVVVEIAWSLPDIVLPTTTEEQQRDEEAATKVWIVPTIVTFPEAPDQEAVA